MLRILALVPCILPLLAFSQLSIGKTKQDIQQEIKMTIKDYPAWQYQLSETDNSLTIVITSDKKSTLRYEYRLDSKDSCYQQKIITDSERAMKTKLDEVLSIKTYNWKKINENQYISNFESGLILEFPPENTEHSLIIIKMEWTKEFYELLLSQ